MTRLEARFQATPGAQIAPALRRSLNPHSLRLRQTYRYLRHEFRSRSRRLRLQLARLANRPEPGPPEQLHLSWMGDPTTTLTVQWVTPYPGEGLIEYRAAGRSWYRIASEAVPSPGIGGWIHRATLTGLQPGHTYEYRALARGSAGTLSSPTYRTRTAPSEGPITCAFFCDTGVMGRPGGDVDGLERILGEIIEARPTFAIGGGDYAYADKDPRYPAIADGIDAWFRQIQPLAAQLPLMAQYGNHEVDLVERFEDWAPRFAHPAGHRERCYSFDVGPAHFAGFYAPVKTVDAQDIAWLDADLAQARSRGRPWLIVFQHQPIFAHGRSHPANPGVREAVIPVLERHRVDLHLSGHDQNFERTFPLSSALKEPVIASRDLRRSAAGCGTIYAKISPSGKRSDIGHDFSRFTTDQQDYIAARDDTAHHFAMLTVSEAELSVSVRAVVSDEEPSREIDRFSILRG